MMYATKSLPPPSTPPPQTTFWSNEVGVNRNVAATSASAASLARPNPSVSNCGLVIVQVGLLPTHSDGPRPDGWSFGFDMNSIHPVFSGLNESSSVVVWNFKMGKKWRNSWGTVERMVTSKLTDLRFESHQNKSIYKPQNPVDILWKLHQPLLVNILRLAGFLLN